MLSVAFISSGEQAAKPRRQTAKEKLHADALASIANYRIKARERAKKLFAPEYEVLRQLEERAKKLTTK